MISLSERYSIGHRIGRGGVGEVFEGMQTALQRPVAIKLLRPELTRNPAAVARFEREARTTSLLHHPNVVTVFDVGATAEGRRFLVMELLDGETLGAMLDRRGALPVEEALAIARQIVRGMAAGQGAGLVHRDLKPDNIFLTEGMHVKILDFGLATLLADGRSAAREREGPREGTPSNPTFHPEELPPDDAPTESASGPVMPPRRSPNAPPRVSPPVLSEDRLTRPGVLMGTPRYMAPEQALGWRADHRSDLYSFGCIFFEMLAGDSPMPGPGGRDFVSQHIHMQPRRLTDLAPQVPEPIAQIAARLLQKDPEHRYADWSDLAETLRRLGGNLDPLSPTTTPATPPITLLPPVEPYRFLQPFTAGCREIFFGRDRDLQRFRVAWEHPDRVPIVVVTGASGVGKTSFLAARVLPLLEDLQVELVAVRGGARPLHAVGVAVARRLARQPTPIRLDPDRPLPELLDTLSTAVGRTIVLAIDQIEEVFTSLDADGPALLQADIAALLAGGDRQVRMILSLREDYLGSLFRALQPLPLDEITRTIPLRPLELEDIREALVGPGRPGIQAAYRPFVFEQGLVDEIVADLLADRAGEVAPRIQAVGSKLWEMVRNEPAPVINRAHYRDKLGGARGILARILDEAIEDLDLSDRGVGKELLRALTHLPGSATSRPAPESELTGHAADRERRTHVLHRLEDRWRLVQGHTDPRWPEERTFRLAHEALIERIQQYGEEGTDRNRARQLFHHGLALWLQGGQREVDLLPEPHCETVLRHIQDLVLRTPEEREFAQRSVDRYNEGWWRRHQEERRSRVRRRLTLGLGPAALLAMGFAAGQAPDFRLIRMGITRILSSLRFSGVDWSGADLQGFPLAEAWLRGADLRAADLRDSALRHADLQQADLSLSHLEGADLREAILRGATLVGANLDGADFRGADLRAARVETSTDGAQLQLALFDLETRWGDAGPPPGALGPGGRAADLVATGASLPGLDLFQIDATRARMAGADLSGASLVEARMDHIDLRGANLRGVAADAARLRGARLAQTDLRRASLRRADLTGADLSGADLRDALLTASVLDGVDLCGADLRGADLTAASQENIRICSNTLWTDAPKDLVADEEGGAPTPPR